MNNYLQIFRFFRRRVNLRSFGSTNPLYQPDFDDVTFMHSLQAASPDAVARHFRTRSKPVFFVQPHEISTLIERFWQEHPNWYNATLSRVKDDGDVGLPIYAQIGPPLNSSFPWNDLPPGPGKDDLYSIRPHRFAFAPRTALVAHTDLATAERFKAILESWIEVARSGRCRYCYYSPLSVIQRVLALSWAWVFLAGRPESTESTGLALEYLILKILWADCCYLSSRLGRSFPNNHLIADFFLIWFLQTVFPELAAAASIKYNPEALWFQELERQVYPDGTGFEHSAHYHEFVAELGAAYILLSRRNGLKSPDWVIDRIRNMLRFQSMLTGPEAIPVLFGNAIEEAPFPLDPEDSGCSASLRELYRSLFQSDIAPAHAAASNIMRAWWLLGGKTSPPPLTPAGSESLLCFDHGGFIIMNDRGDNRLIFRTGPAPNTELIAGHMHADLLSIELSLGGNPFLIDAGTYSYRHNRSNWPDNVPAWRDYFAGPSAHNGPCLAGEDPLGSLQGDFRETSSSARVKTRTCEGAGLVLAEAVLCGAGSYNLTRRNILQVDCGYWLVCDLPPPAGNARTKLSYGFQFAPGTSLKALLQERGEEQSTASFQAEINNRKLYLLASVGQNFCQLLEGSNKPLGGWVSRRYGCLEPAPQLRFSLADKENGIVAFLLQPDGLATHRMTEIDARLISQNAALITLKRLKFLEYILLGFGDGRVQDYTLDNGIHFTGKLLCIRLEDERIVSLQWLDGIRFEWLAKGVAISAPSMVSELRVDGTTRLPAEFELKWPH